MKKLVMEALGNYRRYESEKNLLEKWPLSSSDAIKAERLALLELRLTIINCWLNLLNAHESFIICASQFEELPWKTIVGQFRTKWGSSTPSSKRSLCRYMDIAVDKIIGFSQKYLDIILPTFETMQSAQAALAIPAGNGDEQDA